MKKFLYILLCLVLASGMILSCAACTPPEPELTKKEKVMSLLDELAKTPELTEINSYHSDYDAMVDYLKEQGVIAETAEAVDMNTTAGYVKKHNGTYNDVKKIADKAFDYGGIWLIWFDLTNLDNATSMKATYDSLVANHTIILNGGEYTLALGDGAINGCFALMYGDNITDGQKTDFTAKFKAIDDTVLSLDYMNIMDVAKALKEEGLIENVINFVNVNEKYSFDTFSVAWDQAQGKYVATPSSGKVKVADSAQDYDGITIYYYNIGNCGSKLAEYYEKLKTDKSYDVSFGYYATADEAVQWKTVNADYKYGAENNYDAEGTQLTITVDAVYGRFAVAVSDDAN
mgnify:CR=1 FL=1